ncbi:single-stranded-DNA-specific exonuclease RecJ [Pseudocolwellia agarivorans]|uniref:single-stranded-DNA-specific exonuclease RecJ n=1 Tax=Pseudocolwellia agarivorans TaxID=1911682 RepID=UPI0009869124|nr:single-stranded-DNA-specific exonuclease RecJ [Pseudocolwellia agarivorans]
MQKKILRRPTHPIDNLPHSLHPIIKQIYASRGVAGDNELLLNVAQLAPVDSLKDITLAAQILHQAFVDNLNICIIGDFDADGATSTALMTEAFNMLGYGNHQFIVPNRFEFGYGLTPEIVDMAAAQGAQLLVTVDNGISCLAGVKRAKALGLQVVITDHHLPGKELPDADAIVNPNQPGCSFVSKSIAGVGVAFYLMLALRKHLREQQWFETKQIKEPNIAQLLDLVALGTVADVVTLDNNNRILVSQGLKRIRAGQTRPGIQALLEIAGKNQQRIVASDFGFALGPRINAAGRLDDMSFGINCLLAKDLMTARTMAAELDELNKARRSIEQGMQFEAEKIMAVLNYEEGNLPNAISLFQKDWHQGVIGIVAGRLKEKYHRPSIVFAAADIDNPQSEIKGSARSIPGLHIRDLLEHIDSQHPQLIKKFGGHAMAAGLSIDANDFETFQGLFNQYAGQWIAEEDLQGTLLSDGELNLPELTLEFAELIRESGPWGQNFAEPIFDDEFLIIQQRIVGEKHLKVVLQKDNKVFDGIAFNVDITQWPNQKANQVHVAYKLDVNEFRGKQSVQFLIEEIQVAS